MVVETQAEIGPAAGTVVAGKGGAAAEVPPLPSRLLWPGVVAAVLAIVGWVVWRGSHGVALGSMLDLQVYRDGGLALRHGPQLYSSLYTSVQLPFTYPPFAAAVFAVASLLSFSALSVLMAVVSVLALFAVAWLCWGRLGHPASKGRLGAALLVGAAALWTEPVQQTLSFGQVNLVLLLLVVADLCLPDRFFGKGVGIGIAAGFKLVPVIFIPYLLLTRRWRAAAVASGTLAATVVGAYALFPHESRQYWGGLFLDSARVGGVGFVGNQSLHGLVDRALRGGPAVEQLWILGAGTVVLLGLALAAALGRRGQELAGMTTTGLVGLLASPISWSHHWVWILPGLVLATDRTLRRASRRRLIAPVALLLLFAAWPHREPSSGVVPAGLIWLVPFRDRREYGWSLLQLPLGELYTLLGLAVLVLLGGCALRVRRRA